jgi:hypothetical protein
MLSLVRSSLCLLVAISLLAQSGIAQGAADAKLDAWMTVKSLRVGERLLVRLKTSKSVEGRLLQITDEMLRLSRREEILVLKREEVAKIYLLPEDSKEAKTYGAIGGAIGGAVGLLSYIGLGISGGRGGVVAGSLLLLGAPVVGGLIGRRIGEKRSRKLIYETASQGQQKVGP